MTTAKQFVNEALKYLGFHKGSTVHKQIIDGYNAVKPLPLGYAVSYQDEWCDTFVSFVAIKTGATALIGRECGVERHKAIFRQLGIWLGVVRPKIGDIIIFRWDGNRSGWANHIGIVAEVNGDYITTVEGNTGYPQSYVGKVKYLWNDARIQGYARPKWGSEPVNTDKTVDELAQEVLLGLHGDGEARKQSLGNKYGEVQKKINAMLSGETDKPMTDYALKLGDKIISKSVFNKMLSLCKQHKISLKFVLAVLYHEGLWGYSNVGKTDNNWGGMTMPAGVTSTTRSSGVKVTRGLSRPVSEGGYYIRYASPEDFLTDWFYLLRNGGSYKVAGKEALADAVKGMFRHGGATYDYAIVDVNYSSQQRYQSYLVSVSSRLKSIEQENGSLDKYEKEIFGEEVAQDTIEVIKDDLEVTINGVTYKLVKQ